MPSQRREDDTRAARSRPGDRLLAVGVTLFAVGLLAALVTIVPIFVRTAPLPVAFYLAAALAPVGLAVALLGMLRSNRSRRRPARRRS